MNGNPEIPSRPPGLMCWLSRFSTVRGLHPRPRQHFHQPIPDPGFLVGDWIIVLDEDGGRCVMGRLVHALPGAFTATTPESQPRLSIRWLIGHPASGLMRRLQARLTEEGVIIPLSGADLESDPELGALWRRRHDSAGDLHFEILCKPPTFLPSLYQSPFADLIHRDFRWRDYLAENPVDAATGVHDRSSAWRHFIAYGYYEHFLSDPGRLDGFDAGDYLRRQPETGLRDEHEARLHHHYLGYYQWQCRDRLRGVEARVDPDDPGYGDLAADFRWRDYLAANPDVGAGVAPESLADTARHHFFHQGIQEGRIFDPDRIAILDPAYYRQRYPELGLLDDAEAQRHYCYRGHHELRYANRDTEWLAEADLHVFQMGKVGSHSIAQALQAVSGIKVVHAHWMVDFHTAHPSCSLPYSYLLNRKRDRPLRIVSATRDIVSWALAGLFQVVPDDCICDQAIEEWVDLRFWEVCRSGLEWFDHGYFQGLDVYAQDFQPSLGYQIIRHGDSSVLIYRVEDLERVSPHLAEFVGAPQLSIDRRNQGSRKGYAETYARVRKHFRLPGNLLGQLLDSRFMSHFYAESERQALFERWVARG